MTPQSYRPFLKALYPVGALLVVAALIEPLFQVWPLQFGEVRWRFGAVGVMSAAMVGVIFGIAWMMAVAALLEHRSALRAAAMLNLALAGVMIVVVLLFGLDFLQVRSTLNPDVRGALDMSVLRAVTVLGVSILTTLGLGIGGLRSTRADGRKRTERTRREGDVVFQTQPHGGGTPV